VTSVRGIHAESSQEVFDAILYGAMALARTAGRLSTYKTASFRMEAASEFKRAHILLDLAKNFSGLRDTGALMRRSKRVLAQQARDARSTEKYRRARR
jgi:hypothetical protein